MFVLYCGQGQVIVVRICGFSRYFVLTCTVLAVPVASNAVAGTIFLSCDKEIRLLLKSCLIPLSFRNGVPPITGQCSFLQTRALYFSGKSSL